ncbi:uncharacterized protein I206_107085 [Kwoniella pini CBS 10737]|uniref:Endopeptidase S2P n=1 Tax=Kwoniella pini CBS 10737 TaxID=1296096 RepID=A0A1B9HZ90_9TREE|nr:uncharacterized protein I206_05371 [Kwoniella pini CBS 10737]OCF48592.1 hypothetical protein I206_05371 [Kwoniella pini CBS 10737]
MGNTFIILPTIILVTLILSIYYTSKKLTSRSSNSQWEWERSGLNVSLYTSTLNDLPRILLNKLNIGLARKLKIIYSTGIGFGLLGLIIALLGSFWATYNVWLEVLIEIEIHTLQKVNMHNISIVKRDLAVDPTNDLLGNEKKSNWDFAGGLQPLVPGLTMPWSHLPTLILALILNQLIHEFGHAISAALDDIQPSRFSVNLHVMLPSMMVSFPSSIDTLDPNTKMRLATSGPFHNLLTWFFIWLLTFGGLGNLFWYDRSKEGIVVQDIQWNSPLYNHLEPGSLITHLDDVSLSSITDLDLWSNYLLSDKIGDEGSGWCMNKTTFQSQLDSIFNHCDKTTNKIIFESMNGLTKGMKKCLNPNPILNIKSTKCPCPDSRWVCVRPIYSEQILRIGIKENYEERIIIYKGPREEVLRNVKVGKKDARGWPSGIRWSELFVKYLSTIALSLFFFNLLPLPLTDGSQLLISLLQWESIYKPSVKIPLRATLNNVEEGSSTSNGPNISLYKEYDFDSDEEEEEYIGSSSQMREFIITEVGWKRWFRRGVQWFTMSMVGFWTAGWAMLFLLRSS